MANSKTQSKQDERQALEELTKNVPALKPASQFRQRERSKLLGIAVRLEPFIQEDGTVSLEDNGAKLAMLEYVADADEFFESIAIDRDAYVAWSTGLKDSERVFGALLATYQEALGE